jgi:hypothetical protein
VACNVEEKELEAVGVVLDMVVATESGLGSEGTMLAVPVRGGD